MTPVPATTTSTPVSPAAAARSTGTGTSASFSGRSALLRKSPSRRRPSSTATAAAAAAGEANAGGPRVEEPSTALLLAWFACGNRSLFAAQCLVEVLVELYREGRTFGELQLSLKLATQGARRRRDPRVDSVCGAGATQGAGSGGEPGNGGEEAEEEAVLAPLLQGQEEDVLVSWVALVMLTLEELGLPRDRQPSEQLQQQQGQQQAGTQLGGSGSAADGAEGGIGGGMAAGNAYLRGMMSYVRQTLGMYDEGQTLARVAGLQGLVQQSSGAASSPSLVLMQQYTRLVLLTVEVVAAAQLPTARPLLPPETVQRPSGYSQAFTGSCNAAMALEDDAGGSGGAATTAGAEACPARGLAVRLLMAFIGAVLGSQWSLAKFVEAVRVAYDQGLAADELFWQLDEQEFVQSGGLLPIAGAAGGAAAGPTTAAAAAAAAASASGESEGGAAEQPPPPTPVSQYQITKSLLSNWISLSYMTLAQLAVPYPAAGQRLGWAWAGFGDPIEALGMNDFVGNVLRQMAGEDPRVVPQPTPEPEPQSQQTAGADPDGTGPSTAPVGIAERVSSSETAAPPAGDRRRGGALMVRVEDESLPATSTAVRVLTQQVALVQAVCRQVMIEGG